MKETYKVDLYSGSSAPSVRGRNVRWISQSAQHVYVSDSRESRFPIVGSAVGQAASQEFSPWYNPTLDRYEAILNMSGNFMFTYAEDPIGPWAAPVQVYGNGVGGEPNPAPQASAYVEGTTIYVVYCPNISGTMVAMAKATMPTSVGSLPVFSKMGNVWDTIDSPLVSESPFIVKAYDKYYIFNKRLEFLYGTTTSLETAHTTTPFVTVSASAGVYGDIGTRWCEGWGRPQVIFEDGVWVLFAHVLSSVDLGYAEVRRWICTDGENPVNWVSDGRTIVRQLNQHERDQVCDFRAFRSKSGAWFGYWSANDNNATKFSIMCSPMVEPIMKHSGSSWVPCSDVLSMVADRPHMRCDAIGGNFTIKNTQDVPVDTSSGVSTVTIPQACSRQFFRLANAPRSGTGNDVRLSPFSGDALRGPVRIVSASCVGTTVTVVTATPHGLVAGMFVTVSGFSPSGYNGVYSVDAIQSATSYTYTVGATVGATTSVGAYDTAIQPGESRRYVSYGVGWVRG